MKEETLNYDDVAEKLDSDDGIMQEPDLNWILEYIAANYGGNLDNTSSWAMGKEGLLIYTESTADSYDVYACTHEHNGTKDFGSDIYYYVDGAEFAERALDTLCQGRDVWIADHVWDEMEDDFECALEEWWSDLYEDLHQDKVDELINDGYEYEE
tara:strand:+ start:370 stop:834 length:465 start_codon:yes stop_codon:yes gene_type:complete